MRTEHENRTGKKGTGLPPATLEGIQRVARQIVHQFHLQKVVPFGSYAYGHPTEDSDVDILVVMDSEESPLRMAAQIAAAIEHPFSLDIVVRAPEEFAAAVRRKGVFATEVATKGVTLYEAGNAGMA
jgi:uncharacterized protein